MARLSKQEKEHCLIEESQRQKALEALKILDTAPDERVDRVTRLAQQLFGVPMVSVSLLDRERQWRKSQIGLGGREAARANSFCDYTVQQNSPVVIEDAAGSDLFAQNPFVTGDPHLRFYAAEPLRAPGGEPVGTLCILDTEPRSFGRAEQELLHELAYWVQSELTREEEIDHAAMVQMAFHPTHLPVVPGYTIAAGTQPAGRLSGDAYDVMLRHNVLRLTLADAMGHGLGPALAAVFLRASLATALGRSVQEAMEEADRLLDSAQGDSTMFATAVHADIDLATGSLELVDAGHGLTFILRVDGSFEQLRSTGLPLGMGAAIMEARDVTRRVLLPGEILLCCSDGLLDVLSPDELRARVIAALRELGPEGAVQEALRLARCGPAPDDVTVLVVRRDH